MRFGMNKQIGLLWILAYPLFAETVPQLYWEKTSQESEPVLVVRLLDLFSPTQKEILDSGFTTQSRFEIYLDSDRSQMIAQKACDVVFKLWEQIYFIHGIFPEETQVKAENFEAYAQSCLSIWIPKKKLMQVTELTLSVGIKQISKEQAEMSKKWLLEQQNKGLLFLPSILDDMSAEKAFQQMVKVPEIPKP